jgi:hypothetical protein
MLREYRRITTTRKGSTETREDNLWSFSCRLRIFSIEVLGRDSSHYSGKEKSSSAGTLVSCL